MQTRFLGSRFLRVHVGPCCVFSPVFHPPNNNDKTGTQVGKQWANYFIFGQLWLFLADFFFHFAIFSDLIDFWQRRQKQPDMVKSRQEPFNNGQKRSKVDKKCETRANLLKNALYGCATHTHTHMPVLLVYFVGIPPTCSRLFADQATRANQGYRLQQKMGSVRDASKSAGERKERGKAGCMPRCPTPDGYGAAFSGPRKGGVGTQSGGVWRTMRGI